MAPAPTYQLRHLSDDGTKSAPFSEAYDSPSALGGFVGYLLQQIRALRVDDDTTDPIKVSHLTAEE